MVNYEQKYKEALSWMKDLHPTLEGSMKEDAEHYFPELKDSEDDDIRKSIIKFLQTLASRRENQTFYSKDFDSDLLNKWADWLEKRGEQKIYPKFRIGDKIKLKRERSYPFREIIDIRNDSYYFDGEVHLPFHRQDEWELKQKPDKWSEDDDKMRALTIYYIREYQLSDRCDTTSDEDMDKSDACEKWLKSLKPQSHWKPSECQIKTLEGIINKLDKDPTYIGYNTSELHSLYNDLKKL